MSPQINNVNEERNYIKDLNKIFTLEAKKSLEEPKNRFELDKKKNQKI